MQDPAAAARPALFPGASPRRSGSGPARVRVVAPAGPVDPEALEAGLAVLRGRGLEVIEGLHARCRTGYLAGDDAERLADLQEALDDPTADVVWFARGGYGTTRLLTRLRWDPERPSKTVAGYSDATALHLWGRRFPNLRSLYAPSVTELGRPGVVVFDSLWAALENNPLPVPGRGPAESHGPFPVAGGCLSLCVASAGTPWAPDTGGCWVFFEEVGEALYRVDRALTHLAHAGWFDRAAGLLLGGFTDLGGGETPADVEARARELLPLGTPLVTALPVGHLSGKHTLPLGRPARWDGRSLRF